MNDSYKEIEFLDTDPEGVLSEMILKFEEMTKRTLYPASPERIFIAWMAAIIVQQRVLINEIAKMNVPRYAAKSENEEYLDNLAEIFRGTERLPAKPASATFRFYISEAQPQSTIIPAGTRISADGAIMFFTSDVLEIKAGETSGEVEAVCTQPGTIGNGFAIGQVKEVVDLFDYYQKAENITPTSGGAEREDNESYYGRMRESMESFSTAGPMNGYIYHAKSVSSAVADATAYSPEPGKVDVKVLIKENGELTQTIIQEIQRALNADDVRPLTDYVTVSEPEEIMFGIDVTFFMERTDKEKAVIIENSVKEAIESYAEWQTEKMGRDINPSYLIKKIMDAGAKRVEVRQPAFQVVKEIEIGRLETRTVINGGFEDV